MGCSPHFRSRIRGNSRFGTLPTSRDIGYEDPDATDPISAPYGPSPIMSSTPLDRPDLRQPQLDRRLQGEPEQSPGLGQIFRRTALHQGDREIRSPDQQPATSPSRS